jgi:hypothetical protein
VSIYRGNLHLLFVLQPMARSLLYFILMPFAFRAGATNISKKGNSRFSPDPPMTTKHDRLNDLVPTRTAPPDLPKSVQ